MQALTLISLIIARGYAACELIALSVADSASITKNRAGNPYPLAEGNSRNLLKVTDKSGKLIPFGWVDVTPKGTIAGYCAPSYRSSHGYAAVHGDVFMLNPKAFHALVDGKKDDSAPVMLSAPAVDSAPAPILTAPAPADNPAVTA